MERMTGRSAVGAACLAVLCVLAAAGGAGADERGDPFTYTNYAAVGGVASSVSGIGLSVGYHFSNPLFFRVAGGGQTVGDQTFYSVGAELQYDLSKGQMARFYVVGGGGMYGAADSSYTAFGAGIGGEVALGYKIVNHMAVGFDLFPMTLYDTGTRAEIHPGGSLYFSFNF